MNRPKCKKTNAGLSIEKLYEQIGKTNEDISRYEHRSAGGESALTQMVAMQTFQGKMKNKDHKIELIKHQSKDIKKMMQKICRRPGRRKSAKERSKKKVQETKDLMVKSKEIEDNNAARWISVLAVVVKFS